MRIPAHIVKIHQIFRLSGHECYVVGGAVRSLVLGLAPKDWDVATDAHPDQIMRLFHKTIPTGVKHGTVTIRLGGQLVETTTYRIEGSYADGRHPDHIDFSGFLTKDLARRDFSINSMALDIPSGEIIDPFGGRLDCRAGLIRAIGDPTERFSEDGLRILRAVRFAAQLGFTIHPATINGIKSSISTLRKISWERIREEFVKILTVSEPSGYLELMSELGILSHVLPELQEARGVAQEGRHQYDVFHHCIFACDGAPADHLTLRLAALLHDIGKPASLSLDSAGGPTFHDHERMSASMTETVLKRFRFPGETVKQAVHLVRHHMFNYDPAWSDGAVRRFVARVGIDRIHDLILLRLADRYGFSRSRSGNSDLLELMDRIRLLADENSTFDLRDLAVNGTAIQAALGLAPGPTVGAILDWLLEAVLDDPGLNESATLLRLARNFLEQRIAPG